MKVEQETIQISNRPVRAVTLSNTSGSLVRVLALGATLDSFSVVLKNGQKKELVVSPIKKGYYDQQFEHVPYYFGATVGRYAGRLGKDFIKLNGEKYPLFTQNGIHLHGGKNGLSRKIWEVRETDSKDSASVTFFYFSPHLEEGYPGNLEISAKYTLFQDNSLEIKYTAVSDQDTILNLTNHTYFNLGNSSILNQKLHIDSEKILETDSTLIPTGKMISVVGSAYDFSNETGIDQIEHVGGLDTTYCFDSEDMKSPKITYSAPDTGLKMKIFSNQHSSVVFAPPLLNLAKNTKLQNLFHNNYPSICFELQNYPDSPNHLSFPDSILPKSTKYQNITIYKVEYL